MPIHDWTRVDAGTWHDFHLAWIAEIRTALNEGILPEGFYALAEQVTGPYGPDVLTMQETHDDTTPYLNGHSGTNGHARSVATGGIALATNAPRTRLSLMAREPDYTFKQRVIAIRHRSRDRIVALIELVSPGNKSAREKWDAFIGKAIDVLKKGYHLLAIDLFPPTRRDPLGLHNAIWSNLGQPDIPISADEPLTLASYVAGEEIQAFVEPTAVGRELIEMPLFLSSERYVNVPLEPTYLAAYRGIPKHLKAVLEGTP